MTSHTFYVSPLLQLSLMNLAMLSKMNYSPLYVTPRLLKIHALLPLKDLQKACWNLKIFII